MDFILAHKVELLGLAWATCELLAVTPLKSNSIFQLIVNIVKTLTGRGAKS